MNQWTWGAAFGILGMEANCPETSATARVCYLIAAAAVAVAAFHQERKANRRAADRERALQARLSSLSMEAARLRERVAFARPETTASGGEPLPNVGQGLGYHLASQQRSRR